MINTVSICETCSKNPCKWMSGTVEECPGYREKEEVQDE